MREYKKFSDRGANFRIACSCFEQATAELVRLRSELEAYLRRDRRFGEALDSVAAAPDAPLSARRMAAAAAAVGVGPMAAVAGVMAELAVEVALAAGSAEAVIENGGDLVACTAGPLTVGLYAGASPLSDRLALRVDPAGRPLALCSSSSRMGHSLSMGDCDLATVVARDAALADAAATHAANLVRSAEDIDAALEAVMAIAGIDGVILVKGERIGLAGHPGELLANRDAELRAKVTRDPLAQELPR